VLLEDLGQDLAMMARLVQSQLVAAMTAFFQRDTGLAAKVTEKDDHVDNLLGFIEEKCFERIAGEAPDSARSRRLRGIFRVAMNLEKLGDYAVSIAEQTVHASRLRERALPFDLAGPTRVALAALDEVITAFSDADAEKAKHACRCEAELDRQYREALAEVFRWLGHAGQEPAFVVTCLFVANYLERIGDAILNIGETTLFILTGQRLKLHQYLHLEEMVATVAPPGAGDSAVDFRRIWGGISGARVGRLSVGGAPAFIWKEGSERKIDEEIREMQEWNRIVPGLVPDLKARCQRDGRESFLGQFLDGSLLRDLYLARPWEDKLRATRRLLETVRDVWLATARSEPAPVDYVRQIRERLPELYGIHPELETLRRRETRIFGIAHCSLDELLERGGQIEPALAPPVTVRIHGDFNTNNIVYDTAHDRIHFIDVHRGGPGDYLLDVGVFLVSNLRNPIQDSRVVTDLERLNGHVARFAAEFARLIGDDRVQTRLALSQARSLITSGRLVTDAEFARSLYLQGVRLLERAVGTTP
jgi:phosphate transport system regulatory protein PhoU